MDGKIKVGLNDYTGKRFDFESLRSLKDFLDQEVEFWKVKNTELETPRKQNHTFLTYWANLENLMKAINSWETELPKWDDKELQRNLENQVQQHLGQSNRNWLWSGNAIVPNFIECHREFEREGAEIFVNLVLKKQVPNSFSNFQSFMGAISGYEFLNQDSDIVKRSEGEAISLEQLRTQLLEAKNKLFDEVENFKSDYKAWENDTHHRADRLYRLRKALGERQHKKQDKMFEDQLRQWSETITELEKTYEEKLRLEKPAEYWKRSAKKYGFQGMLWSWGVVFLVVVGMVYFREFFLAWLHGQETGIKLNTIQGIILFGAIAAVYAFAVKIFSRLAFSSLHLMRDAEEREQLTYLYLSLTKESAIDEQSRDIVLQALFSRTETGLLAQEHGPSMPGATEAIKSALRGKG